MGKRGSFMLLGPLLDVQAGATFGICFSGQRSFANLSEPSAKRLAACHAFEDAWAQAAQSSRAHSGRTKAFVPVFAEAQSGHYGTPVQLSDLSMRRAQSGLSH